jgi:hypothetical protein
VRRPFFCCYRSVGARSPTTQRLTRLTDHRHTLITWVSFQGELAAPHFRKPDSTPHRDRNSIVPEHSEASKNISFEKARFFTFTMFCAARGLQRERARTDIAPIAVSVVFPFQHKNEQRERARTMNLFYGQNSVFGCSRWTWSHPGY